MQSYELHKQSKNELLMSEVMMSIGNTYQYEGNYAESLKYYEQVIPVFKKFSNFLRILISKSTIIKEITIHNILVMPIF